MSLWTTVTISTNPDIPSTPGEYARTFAEPFDGVYNYEYSEGDGCVVIAIYGTHDVDEGFDALFYEFGNRYLCPAAITVEVEDTGDSRTAYVVRPPKMDDATYPNDEWDVVDEQHWINRTDEGDPEMLDETALSVFEEEYSVPVTTKRDPHRVTPFIA